MYKPLLEYKTAQSFTNFSLRLQAYTRSFTVLLHMQQGKSAVQSFSRIAILLVRTKNVDSIIDSDHNDSSFDEVID